MTKLKLHFLLAILLIIVAVSQASNASVCQTENVTILMISGGQHSGEDRSSSIIANINGHTLTVAFTEYLGNVTIEVKDVYGDAVDLDLIGTPNGYECYIPLAGHYTVYFKLTNGDTYYGDFDVTD